ncbi:MAG: starch-binding protein [Clostridia bacterium]|nr:starch-binding protein [Clostridia bacterium]
MVSKRSRLMALVLAVMTLLSVMAVGALSTSAAGGTVYCENAASWNEVYCYMWKDGSGNNGEWPGVKMTKGDGNLWSYNVSGDWNMIIFNNGSDQAKTGDMNYPSPDGNCFNNSSNGWTNVGTPDVPDDPKPTTPNNPVNPPTPSGDGKVYLKDTSGWGNIHVYMWNSGDDSNAAWPGEKATSLGDGVYEYTVKKAYKNIIFNNGSDASKTGDLIYPGEGQIYDNGTSTWSLYDTSKLHIKSFTADVESPQYTGVKINFTAVAGGGEGDLSYKFSVGNTVLSDFSSATKASWTPATAGTYTVNLEVKDTLGETLSKSLTFEIKDIKAEVKPVIQEVKATPSNLEGTELKKGVEATVDVTAGGGNTGTKLLFYKYTVTDPSGETANVPYFSLKNQYKFTPNTLGTYSVTATVEGSDNSFTARTVEYDCVAELSKPGDLSANFTVKDAGSGKYTATVTAAGGTAPYTYEFKLNDKVVQAASDKATYTFDASADGSYKVEVIVKDAAGKTITKSETIQVGGSQQPTDPKPTDPKPTDPVDQEIKATLAAQEQGNGIFKFTVNAEGGEGAYQYQFSANGAVIKPYSASNTVTLDLSADGTYTIVATVKDENGTEASDTKVLTISGGKVEMPLEVTLTYDETEINGVKYVQITANAIGGEGDYVYECTVDGKNIPAYGSDNVFLFGVPTANDDTYEIVINVKDKSGEKLEETGYAWVKDGVLGYGSDAPEEPTKPTDPVTKPTDPVGEYLKGDADLDGKVNVKDATLIQKHVAKIVEMNALAQANADVDGNKAINIKDATTIQKFVANLIKW